MWNIENWGKEISIDFAVSNDLKNFDSSIAMNNWDSSEASNLIESLDSFHWK